MFSSCLSYACVDDSTFMLGDGNLSVGKRSCFKAAAGALRIDPEVQKLALEGLRHGFLIHFLLLYAQVFCRNWEV